MKKNYEIPVYNAEVRTVVRNRENHPNFEAKWADTHLILVSAHTPEEAVSIYRRKHPEHLGFILGEVTEAF